MATKVGITVDGVEYESKTDACVALLGKGLKKSDIVKTLDTYYPFVLGIEKKLAFENSPGGQAIRDAKAAKIADKVAAKEADAKLKADAKVVRAEAKLAKDVKQLEVAVAATPKAAKKARKVVTNKVPKSSKVNEDAIAEMLGQNDIPAEILADMKADGLVA
jgi:hypothetical protein